MNFLLSAVRAAVPQLCAALFLCFIPPILTVAGAVEISEGLNLEGQKTISYKMSNISLNNRVDQSLRVNLCGNISENLKTDLKIDDSLLEKVERMRFEYTDPKIRLELGDVNFSGITEFGRSEKKMRGLVANLNGISRDSDDNLTFLCTFENGRPGKDIFTGEGRMGPFKLSAEKIASQSERVYIDGILKKRNIDYGLDLENGILTFNEEVPLGAEVYVQYTVETSFDNLNRYSFGAFSENRINDRAKTKVGVLRSEESRQNGGISGSRTEFNLNQEFAVNEKLDTALEFSRSFAETTDSAGSLGEGAALRLHSKLKGRYIDTNVKHTLVGTGYTPYHNGYVRPEKKSEMYFELHPDESGGRLEKVNGSFGLLKAVQLEKDPARFESAEEERLFGRFMYNFDERTNVSTNYQNSGAAGDVRDIKLSSRSSRLNIENGLSKQRRNGGADELSSLYFRASTFPVNKNVYYVEYNDSSLKTWSRPGDENNDFNFKFRRRVSGDLSLGYSLLGSGRRNFAGMQTRLAENRAMADYNLSESLALTGQLAARNERRTNAYAGETDLLGGLVGVKYLPADFVKVLARRETWDAALSAASAGGYRKTDDSLKVIFGKHEWPVALELRQAVRSSEIDAESGADRPGAVTSGAQLTYRPGNKLSLTGEVTRRNEGGPSGIVYDVAKQEVKYRVNDDMDFFLNFERERSLFTAVNSVFRLEARL